MDEPHTENNTEQAQDAEPYVPKSYDELAADPELTEEKLQQELTNYAQALREEFERRNGDEPEEVASHTHDFFKANVHHAAAQIVWLSINAESETVKLNASKFIVSQAVSEEEARQDPLKAILEGLKNNDNKPQPTNRES